MADVKKVKVLEVTYNREFKPVGKQFIIHYFNMKVDDGFDTLEGEFSTNSKEQTKFTIGQSYEVDITTKSNRGGEYLWFDYSEQEKEKRKSSSGYAGGSKKPAWTPYVRPRIEVMSIITQSSYEAAVITATKLAADTVTTHKQIADVARKFSEFIVDVSGLNTTECKAGNKDSLKAANDKSIVYQIFSHILQSLIYQVICQSHQQTLLYHFVQLYHIIYPAYYSQVMMHHLISV